MDAEVAQVLRLLRVLKRNRIRITPEILEKNVGMTLRDLVWLKEDIELYELFKKGLCEENGSCDLVYQKTPIHSDPNLGIGMPMPRSMYQGFKDEFECSKCLNVTREDSKSFRLDYFKELYNCSCSHEVLINYGCRCQDFSGIYSYFVKEENT